MTGRVSPSGSRWVSRSIQNSATPAHASSRYAGSAAPCDRPPRRQARTPQSTGTATASRSGRPWQRLGRPRRPAGSPRCRAPGPAPAEPGAGHRDATTSHQGAATAGAKVTRAPGRRPRASPPAVPGGPVISRNCSAAWWSSIHDPRRDRIPPPGRHLDEGARRSRRRRRGPRPDPAGRVAAAADRSPGAVETTTSTPSGQSPTSRRVTARPAACAWAKVAGRISPRTMKSTRRAPSATNAATTERAVAPEPTTTGRSARCTPTSARAPRTPMTSVLSASQPPSGRRSSVLIEPVSRATSVTVVATSKATSLSGRVSDRPRHSGPSPPTNATSSDSDTSARP